MTHRVLHVSDSPEFGGTERVILQLLEGLDRSRWTSVLLHVAPRGPVHVLAEAAANLGIEHHEATIRSGTEALTAVAALVRQLHAIRPSILHAHLTTPLACRLFLLAAMLARVPAVVATAHLYVAVPSGRSRAEHLLLSAIVDRYLAVSMDVASHLSRQLSVPSRKIRVVRNGIAPAPFGRATGAARAELTGGRRMRVVLAVARLSAQKGHRYLLEAATELPDALIVLAGEGSERAALQRQADALGIAHRVLFLGYRRDVPDLLASADVVVLPSLYEGLPLAVLEGMAAGKPVVATAIGGTAEAIVHGQSGLLVAPSDPHALASAIRTVLCDSQLAATLAASGRARVQQHFHAERMVRQVSDVYDELVS